MRKRSKAYQAYRQKFYVEKKIGNVKQGVRVLTANQYRRARKEGINNTNILKAQTLLHSKREKDYVWREYKKIKKSFSRGETTEMEGSYFGETYEEDEGLSYHYSLSGLLKDKDAIHFMITFRINDGEDRAEVLADYGY